MPKRKRRRQLRSTDVSKGSPEISEVIQPAFVSDLIDRRRERMEARASFGYDDVLRRLEKLIEDVDAVQFLSAFCFATQLHASEDPGEWGEVDHIGQFHNELVQGVMLRRETFQGVPVTPEVLWAVRETLLEVTHLDPIDDRRNAKDAVTNLGQREQILDAIRADWAIVRNWAVPSAVEKLICETWAPIDDGVEAACGLRVEHLVRFLFGFAEEVERRLLLHRRRLRTLDGVQDGATALKRIRGTFPALLEDDDFAERAAEIETATGSELAVRARVLASRSLIHATTLTLEEAVRLYPVPIDSDKLLDTLLSLSIGAGELREVPLEQLHHSNPVHTRPFLRLANQRFSLVVVPLIQSFGVQIVEVLMESHPGLMDRYFRRRGRYLQQRSHELFQRAFPLGEVIANARFRPTEAVSDFENDLLLIVDDTAVIVELKANRVQLAARRGGAGSAEDAVEKLILEPARQAETFEKYMRQNLPRPKVIVNGVEREVDLSAVSHYLKLTITYEQLGLWAQPLPLIESGLIPATTDASRPMLLTDAIEIFDLLPSQATRIDFLERRQWFDRKVHWVGDDLDLVALYLHNHLRVEKPGDDELMLLTHHSIELQPYFVGREKGWRERKPGLELTQLWWGMLERIETDVPGWLGPCRVLLSISPGSQRAFGRDVADLVRRINGSDSSLGEIIITQPEPHAPFVICAFAYLREYQDEHLRIARRGIREILSVPHGPRQALALGFSPGRRLPQTMFVARRPGH